MSAAFTFPNLTALMIFHHEWEAVEVCLKSFRKFYPDGQIMLARDSLNPYIPDNLRYLNPEILSKNDAMEAMHEFHFDSRSLFELPTEQRLQIVMKQINRMKECATRSKNDFILALEYDALVRGKVRVYSGVDLETLSANRYSPNLIHTVESLCQRKVSFFGWGFVVGIVRTSAIIKAAVWLEDNLEVMKHLVELEPNFVFLDFLMPMLIFLSGGNVEDNGLTVECSRDRFWRYRKAPLLHQYRGRKVSKLFHHRYTS